eukprot:scaffold37417_cov31-Tisochrysis_lutea.AAC.2
MPCLKSLQFEQRRISGVREEVGARRVLLLVAPADVRDGRGEVKRGVVAGMPHACRCRSWL